MTAPHSTTLTPGIARTTIVFLLIALGVAVAAPASAATIEEDVTWGVRTTANSDGSARDNFTYTLKPGETLTDAFVVTNHDSSPITLAVSAADGFTTSSGQLDLVTADSESVAIGAWSTFDDSELQLPPGAAVEVPFTVSIPAAATPGDYAGGILTALPQPGLEDGIAVDRRLGIRMHIRVEGELAPHVSVEDMRLTYAGTANPLGAGDATVSYIVRNTGNVRITAGQRISITGPWGMFAQEATEMAAIPELLPGESWEVTMPVGTVIPAFWLTATSTLTPEVAAVNDVTPEIKPVEAFTGTWAIPVASLTLIVLLIGAAVASLGVSRRRRKRRAQREDERVRAAVEQALLAQDAAATTR